MPIFNDDDDDDDDGDGHPLLMDGTSTILTFKLKIIQKNKEPFNYFVWFQQKFLYSNFIIKLM